MEKLSAQNLQRFGRYKEKTMKNGGVFEKFQILEKGTHKSTLPTMIHHFPVPLV